MKHLFSLLTFATVLSACFPAPGYQQYSRNNGMLPNNPDPNKCYVRTVTLDEYETWTEEYLTYTEAEADEYPHRIETLVLTPKYSQWETTAYEGCESPNPNDCQVLCYRTYEAETTQVYHPLDTTKGQATYQNYDFERVIAKGGLSAYEEIDCALTIYNILPVGYERGATTLSVIDQEVVADELLALMQEHPNLRIQVNGHTDSRGPDGENLNLSEQRVESIADYLVGRGINRRRIVTRGYGETQLLNDCKDGADCSEEEHLENERIEFRVLNIDSK